MSYKDLIRVETKRQELEKLISEECGDGSLMFYGSCRNGFGSKVTSDYDMSFKLDSFKLKMSFVDRKEESQSPLKVLYQVFRVLSKSDLDCEAEFISTAKIPIVTAPNWRGIEIDISYDNFSGIENTELLRTYCAWAPNILPQLEFWVKKWAKANEICGGEKLFFKTYHWYLLTIYYLQQYGWRTLRKYWKNRDRVVPYIQKVIQIHTPLPISRRSRELAHPICMRDPFFQGRSAWQRLTEEQRKTYRRTFESKNKQNIAAMVPVESLNHMLSVIRRSAQDMRVYANGGEMKNSILKKFFNLQ